MYVLGGLSVFPYGPVKPGPMTLAVTIFLNETAEEQPDSEWEERLRENPPEYRSFEQRIVGEEEPSDKTGTWRVLFLP